MDLDTTADRHKAENLVAIDRLTAASQLIVDTFQVTVDDEDII